MVARRAARGPAAEHAPAHDTPAGPPRGRGSDDKRARAVKILEALGIKSRDPVAIEYAQAWAVFVEKTAKGCDARVACAVAGIGESTWYKWKRLGSEHFEVIDGVRARVQPAPPFDELVTLWRRADGMARAKAQEGMLTAAEGGNVIAADRYLWRKEAQAKARIESETATAKLELLRLQAEQERVKLEQEQLKLQRMREGGPDSTVATFQNVVILPALDTGPGISHVIGTIDGTPTPALPEGSRDARALDGDADAAALAADAAAAGGVVAEPWAADGLPPLDGE